MDGGQQDADVGVGWAVGAQRQRDAGVEQRAQQLAGTEALSECGVLEHAGIQVRALLRDDHAQRSGARHQVVQQSVGVFEAQAPGCPHFGATGRIHRVEHCGRARTAEHMHQHLFVALQ